jgi:hypothetical protein
MCVSVKDKGGNRVRGGSGCGFEESKVYLYVSNIRVSLLTRTTVLNGRTVLEKPIECKT